MNPVSGLRKHGSSVFGRFLVLQPNSERPAGALSDFEQFDILDIETCLREATRHVENRTRPIRYENKEF